MIIKSSRKRNHEFRIHMQSADGTIHTLERKDRIKYLGVMLDETVSFKYHIAYVCSRMSRNLGIISSELRYYLTLSHLKQIYYSLIYPYISYAILAWGSTYKTYIQKVQTKQNQAIRLIFFARTFGEQTDSALPLLNLLELLTVNNAYRLQALKFTHLWHKNLLPNVFCDFFQYAGVFHAYNTRYAANQNLYKPRVRTNTEKQTISYMASILWHDIPTSLKNLNVYQFSNQIKLYLFSEQLGISIMEVIKTVTSNIKYYVISTPFIVQSVSLSPCVCTLFNCLY